MNKKNKHIIKICMGSSCFARGNSTNLEIIESFINEKSLQANIELVGARCTAKCKDGPNIIIDNVNYKISSKEELINLLKRL